MYINFQRNSDNINLIEECLHYYFDEILQNIQEEFDLDFIQSLIDDGVDVNFLSSERIPVIFKVFNV